MADPGTVRSAPHPAVRPGARALLVLGMHRCGTSALARVLSLLGGDLPRTLMPAQPDNPDGFWESLPLSRANERWLRALGRSWSDPRPLPPDWRRQLDFAAAVDEACAILAAEFPAAGLWIIKDPRLARLAPVWLEALGRLGVPASALLCLRNPLEVSASLARRNGLQREAVALGWAVHLLEAEHHTRGLPRAVLSFEAMLADWRGALTPILESLGLEELLAGTEAAATVDEFLHAGRRHHASSTPEVQRDATLPAVVKACHAALASETLPLPAVLDPLRAQVVAAAAACGEVDATGFAPTAARQAAAEGEAPARRLLVVHYHLPETHGAPVDALLQRCLGERWHAHEGAPGGWAPVNVAKYLSRQRQVLALSSATARLPAPALEGVEVVPLLLLRHPLDRLRELYLREQRGDDPQALEACAGGLRGYVTWRLGIPGERTLRDPQTQRLAFGLPRAAEPDETLRARRVLSSLPLTGLLEHPATWLPPLEVLLRRLLPGQRIWLPYPAEQGGPALELRLASLRAELGDGLFTALLEANCRDLALWSAIASGAGIPSP